VFFETQKRYIELTHSAPFDGLAVDAPGSTVFSAFLRISDNSFGQASERRRILCIAGCSRQLSVVPGESSDHGSTASFAAAPVRPHIPYIACISVCVPGHSYKERLFSSPPVWALLPAF
jgi:hypothetical protein